MHDKRRLQKETVMVHDGKKIPAEADVLEVSNGVSRALIYLDRNGRLQELMVGD